MKDLLIGKRVEINNSRLRENAGMPAEQGQVVNIQFTACSDGVCINEVLRLIVQKDDGRLGAYGLNVLKVVS